MADDLTPKQHKAIEALLVATTLKEAATQAGCTDRALRGWLDEPAFQAAYRAARRLAVGQSIARMQQVSSDAVDRLKHLLTCGKPAVELGAARSILEFAVKAVELEDIEARLAALEAQQHGKHP